MPKRFEVATAMLVALMISAYCFIAPATGTETNSFEGDTTECPPGFTAYENLQTQRDSGYSACVSSPKKKIKKTWEEADKLCRSQHSFLFDYDPAYYNSTELVQSLRDDIDSDWLWVGIRKVSGFYSRQTFKPKLFKSNSQSLWGNTWYDDTHPTLDCVALSAKSGNLVTENCSSLLPFSCMNQGYSTKPTESPLCPSSWKFSYLLDSDRSSCFQLFEPQKFLDSKERCKQLNGSLITTKDYHGLYKMLKVHYINPNVTAYWVNERETTNGPCTVRAKTAPPAKMKWKVQNCSDILPFICKRPVDNSGELNVWISESGKTPGRRTGKESRDIILACNVNISCKLVSDPRVQEDWLSVQWLKDGVPLVDADQPLISPSFASSATTEFGELVSRQGSYQCRVLIDGYADYITSSEVDVFFSDVSTYILTLEGENIPYNVSQDFTRIEFQTTISYIKKLMEGLLNQMKNKFKSATSVQWDFHNVDVKESIVTLKTILFITWDSSSGQMRPKNEKEEVYEHLLNFSREQFQGDTEVKLDSADTCFEEEMNVSLTKKVLWPESPGTTNVTSIPACFDEQGTLITRICKASFSGARWLPLPSDFICLDNPLKEYCFEEQTKNDDEEITILNWPRTRIGTISLPVSLCFTETLKPVVRRCVPNVGGSAEWAEVDGICKNGADKLSELTTNLQNLSKTEIDDQNVLESIRILSNLTLAHETLQPMDIHYVAKTLENIASSTSNVKVIQSAIQTLDNVMSMNPATVEEMQRRLNSSSRITDSLERIVTTADLKSRNGSLSLSGKTVVLKTWKSLQKYGTLPTGVVLRSVDKEETVETLTNGSGFKTGGIEVAVALPLELVAQKARVISDSAKKRSLNFIIYRNSSLFDYNASEVKWKPNSYVIHVDLGPEKIQNQDPPIEMIFKPFKVDERFNISCGYWNQSLNNNFGGWCTDGCHFWRNDSFFCSCNHLTNFALLLAVDPNWIPEADQFALQIITYVGCGLSIFGLGMTILTFIIFRKWRKGNKHRTLFNLSTALIFVLVTFVFGIDKTETKLGCTIVAVLLHYFLLASFAWMLVEAVIQYLSFVKVLSTYIPRFMRKAMICAWGSPLVIVSLTLFINYEVYNERENYCWISHTVSYYTVALPIGLLMITNVIVFCLVVYSVTWGRPKNMSCNQDERRQSLMRLRASVCIFFLLGLSWLFGFLAVGEARVVFQYLFSLTTTLQGFLIFVFCVVQEKTARELWKNLLVRSVGQAGKSHTTHSTGDMTMSEK